MKMSSVSANIGTRRSTAACTLKKTSSCIVGGRLAVASPTSKPRETANLNCTYACSLARVARSSLKKRPNSSILSISRV